MQIFDVTGLECRYVKPTMNLTRWASANQPFAVCNASLYDFITREPVGTIIENGKQVHNAGNGFGVGIKDGKLSFGTPWGDAWSDYLTGYNSPVQGGKYNAPTFRDKYVFESKLSRIGIGRKSGRIYIVTTDSATLRQYAEDAIKSGFDTLVNLDGGGSRHLYYNKRTVYSSTRLPYNALAFYQATQETPNDGGCPYAEPTRNLYYGCRGEDVKWLQWQLIRHGHNLSCADGIFGPNTWRETVAFQRTFTKWPDGICGPNTRRELKK